MPYASCPVLNSGNLYALLRHRLYKKITQEKKYFFENNFYSRKLHAMLQMKHEDIETQIWGR